MNPKVNMSFRKRHTLIQTSSLCPISNPVTIDNECYVSNNTGTNGISFHGIISSLDRLKLYRSVWKAYQWPLNVETLISSVPPRNSLVSVYDFWPLPPELERYKETKTFPPKYLSFEPSLSKNLWIFHL